jgi:hypothetical protein
VLTIVSSDPGGPVAIALSGTGVAVPAPSFLLTVNGANTAAVTVTSGQPANFPLLLTSVNGYSGGVALTCVTVTGGPHASCSLSAPLLTLQSGSQATTAATISTLSSAMIRIVGGVAWLVLCPLVMTRRKGRTLRAVLVAIFGFALFAGTTGCGGSSSAPVAPSVVYTPAGAYQYQVTASSTSGVPVSSTVTLNVIVQ